MSCCSQRRNAAPAATQLRAAASVPITPRPAPGATQRLRYLGAAPLSLRGPFSGRVYEVDAVSRFVEADLRDAEALLRTAVFEPAQG